MRESPLDCKEIQPVHPKGDQAWVFIGRTDAEAEAPVLWPPDVESWLIEKEPDVGKDWRWEEKGTTEDEMVGWHHRHNGHEFEQALGVGMDRGAWHAAAHGVAKSWTQLSDWTEWVSKSGPWSYSISTTCKLAGSADPRVGNSGGSGQPSFNKISRWFWYRFRC